jgi:phospholipid/cholesterol/gamma-HCH transport system substrate-binding protein
MAKTNKERTARVGMLVAAAIVVLMIFLFAIGSEQKIFSRKNEYRVRLDSVSGLAEGNPVKISGVTVGVVKDINLPFDPKAKDVDIQLMVDRKYAGRVRTDSRARLKKLGLLAGDSYVDITPGSPRFDELEPGAQIPAARQTNVDQLISSGEDLVDNLVQISYSLKNVLGRVDRGEGIIGELTSAPETKQHLVETVLATLNKVNAALEHIESGKGLVGKLVYDDAYGEQLAGSLQQTATNLQTLVADVQGSFKSGNGMIPALLNDPAGKQKVLTLVDNLNTTTANLAAVSASFKNGQGLVPRLMNDKAYGDQALGEFTGLVHQLNDTVAKINAGNGTAGKVINDPSIYESINDILIGINESKLLRWLIRNRQQKGIEERYKTEQVPGTQPPSPPATSTSPKSETNSPPDVPLLPPATTTTGGAANASPPVNGSSTTNTPATSTAAPAATSTSPPATTTTAPPATTTTNPPG